MRSPPQTEKEQENAMANSQWYTAIARLDGITDLLQQIVEMLRNPIRTASSAEVDEEARTPGDLMHAIYELGVPTEPPIGTVVLGRSNTTVVRKTSGWQVTGSMLTSSWVHILQHLGPVKVIHVAGDAE
jgi:hypothetical protein